MVNASLNWASICGIVLAIWGLISAPLAIAQILLFLKKNKKDDTTTVLKIIYIFLVTPLRFIGSLLVGGILFFQGWRLDPILQFGMFVLIFLYLSEAAFGFIRDLVKLLQSRRDTQFYLKS